MTYEINITTHAESGTLERLLHPDNEFVFMSILGKLNCIANSMRFMTYSKFNISWLDKKLGPKQFESLDGEHTRNIPNYWGIVKIILSQRLLSDKNLLNKLNKELPTDLDNIRYIPMTLIKRGIAKDLVPNNKLHVYGIILKELITKIISLYRAGYIDDHGYTGLCRNVKEYVWSDVMKRYTGPLAAGISTISNEELYKIYMEET